MIVPEIWIGKESPNKANALVIIGVRVKIRVVTLLFELLEHR